MDTRRYSHRPKALALTSCAVAVEEAIASEHFRVADWCFQHFPARCPGSVTSITALYPFESLLFLREHFPIMFTEAFVAAMREEARSKASPTFGVLAKWLASMV
ncbi:hypothetical protein PHYSODRAFT_307759 [Phytophthora sojae]|uniref:Uncharacterized protein n=1 Tax=Phytophthora sojae (strain P6497) TaxID=1094619 RepID=G5AFY6_PHYSP|nr:hypothetical protein PHYSODRAFT_307759 [Phytophthora sojae]EGZ05502.1 hypothetical protein PHYSODRAFT_307759 [Phytophthora sojae]|eukprot:XP_009539033.1 hypothetical protein PHYSODRAFT_307759 [Phytophthora sojae]